MDLRLLNLAQKGDMDARNYFIESNKPYIHQYASLICKRYLSWENDDELSIALMAFNDAIDTFKEGNFETYSKIIMKNRLIDYFRKNSRNEIPIEDESIQNYTSYTHSIDEKLDRVSQINLFKEIMEDFNITLEDLTRKSPKHRDTREKLIELAKDLATIDEIITVIKIKKILPIKEILLISEISRKTLEDWRKYIIALIIIFSDKRLDSLREFIV